MDINIRNVPLTNLLAFICASSGLRYAVARGAVVISRDIDAYLERLERMPRPEPPVSLEAQKRTACNYRMKQLTAALHRWASDHDGKFPDSLELLYQKGYLAGKDPTSVCCPGSGEPYEYIGEAMSTDKLRPQLVVAFCRKGSHPGGRNVLFVDGHVEWMTEEAFKNLRNKRIRVETE